MDRNKILIVDDVFQVRYSLHQYLTQCGYIVFDADTGVKALETCERLKPDLIITDYNLRDMNCFEYLDALRRYENNLKDVIKISNIPAIVISGYLSEEALSPLMKKLGIFAFMRKPLILPSLLSNVEAILGNNYYMNLSAAKEIVICDTEFRTAKYLAEYLGQHHYETYYCANMIDFGDLTAEVKPDIVIVDCFLETKGFEQHSVWSILGKPGNKSKVILTTFHNPCKMSNTYKALGVYRVIPKPIDLEYLRKIIRHATQPEPEKIPAKTAPQ